MTNLVDIDQYCKLLSEITKLDYIQVKRVVVLYLSSVSVGIISFERASEAIEEELTDLMKNRQNKKRRFMLNTAS